MQKVMLSLARRAAEASMQPLHEARDLSQQYEVRLRAKDITTYQQSLADTLQFDEDEAQVVAFGCFIFFPSQVLSILHSERSCNLSRRLLFLPLVRGTTTTTLSLDLSVTVMTYCLCAVLPEQSGPLHFDDTIAQFSCRLRFNRHSALTYCITQVHHILRTNFSARIDVCLQPG